MNTKHRAPTIGVTPSATHTRRVHFASLVLAGLACGLVIAGTQAVEPSTGPSSQAAVPPGTRLDAANGELIGSLTGRTTSFDTNAAAIGAYGVVSARGYFADLLPSGALGYVLTLVYGSTDCSGAAAIELSSVMGGPLPVPGYVFAFGDPRQIFNVPAGAAARTLAVGSVRQRTRTGYVCEPRQTQSRVYPLEINRADVSGFVDHYATPFAVHFSRAALGATGATARAARPKDETGAGALLPSDTPQCAPGCYTPYIGDGICERECANSLCAFDGGDCKADFVERAKTHEAALCAPACEASNLGDGFCDKDCNVAKCEFDQGDCASP